MAGSPWLSRRERSKPINTAVARVGHADVVDQMLPLAGFTVGVTAARRAEELVALLERRGAKCVHAPSIRLVPLADDTELLAATRFCLQAPPDFVVATTGVGFRGWVEASDGWGLADPLLEVLGQARLLARGPKARGAIRAAGLREEWSPQSESSSEVLEYLLEAGVEGKRVVVQLHGEPLPDVIDALRLSGAEVVQVPVYRWLLPKDIAPMRRMVAAIVSGNMDAVTFTSAPAASALIRVAAEEGLEAELVAAFQGPVMAVAVGPVTAGPLLRRGIAPRVAARSRLGGLVREVVDALPASRPVLPVAGGRLQVRGTGAVIDGQLVALPRAPMQVLRVLASRPGHVITRTELLAALPSAYDEHAVEMAVTRLRAALGSRTVQTVLKRGYRLAYEVERLGECGPMVVDDPDSECL
jgi:uroporphyrinogen-III synthase